MDYRFSDNGIDLGIVLPPCEAPADIWQAVRTAEQLGVHSVWVTDSTLTGMPWLDALSVLGGLAAVTSTLQLGTSVFIAARRNPVLLAHTLTTLDYLSGGRLIFGVGVGEKGFRPEEYAIAGVPVTQRGAITDEYLSLLHRLWAEPAVTHEGPFFQYQSIAIEPKPVRQGKIPTWIGGKADGPLRRAAASGDGWLPALLTPEDYQRLWAQLGEYLHAAGRDAASMVPGFYAFAAIGRTREEARQVLAPAIEGIFHAPFAYFEPLCICGTADDWVEQIGRFADVGVRHVNVSLRTQDLIGDVQYIGEEVVPRLRAAARTSLAATAA